MKPISISLKMAAMGNLGAIAILVMDENDLIHHPVYKMK